MKKRYTINSKLQFHRTILLNAGANVHEDNDALLRDAAFAGNTQIVKLAFEYGANVRANNDEALKSALGNSIRAPEIICMLIERGANVNVIPEKDRARIIKRCERFS